jgi:chromosome partitioning protein
MIIAFVNGKGGVGKSTFCYLTALGLREAGKSVSVEDLDPQQSITAWINEERDGIRPGGDFTLIDTRPALDDDSVHQAIARADIIVIPSSPSPGDLMGMKNSIEIVKRFQRRRSKVFVGLNSVHPGTIFSQTAPEVLKRLGAPVLSSVIPDRQCIQRAVIKGWKALDPDTQAKVLKLTIEIVS